MTDIKYNIHSHPSYHEDIQAEKNSMGKLEDGVVHHSDWNNVIKLYYRNNKKMPYTYRVYFPRTRNLYKVNPSKGGIYI